MSNITNNLLRINNMRMTGFSTGLDIEGMIQKMLTSHQMRLDKAKQQKELLNWQKDAYRSVITKMNEFQSKFLDVLSPSNMMLTSSFRQTMTSAPQSMSQYFEATASSEANGKSVIVNSIGKIATATTAVSKDRVSQPIKFTLNQSNLSNIQEKSLLFTVDNKTETITFANNINDYVDPITGAFDGNGYLSAINQELEDKFGYDNNDNPKVQFAFSESGGVYEFTVVASKSKVEVSASAEVQTALGFTGGKNFINTKDTLGNVFGSALTSTADGANRNEIKFSINGHVISVNRSDSIDEMINKINRSEAGVNISYSDINDKFTITRNETGRYGEINLSEDVTDNGVASQTNLLRLLFGADASGDAIDNTIHTRGQNAEYTINGVTGESSTNTITVDGITITLVNETPAGFTNREPITAKIDSAAVVEHIKNFVEEYNNLVETLNNLLSEKRPKSQGAYYMPLTENQKAELSDKDVEAWEKMGKQGLLRSDPTITRMLSSLRTAVMETVDTANGKISFASIGIKTSSYFEDKSGKLIIDEEKLRKSIENNPDKVMQLFTQQSNIRSGATMDEVFERDAETGRYFRRATADDRVFQTIDINGKDTNVVYVTQTDLRNMRNGTTGVSQRFAEIFKNNINVSVSQGDRGALIKLVGTGGSNILIDRDASLEKKLEEMDKTIERIQNRFYAAETRYYKQFSSLEVALAKLSSQSAFFAGLGGNQQQ